MWWPAECVSTDGKGTIGDHGELGSSRCSIDAGLLLCLKLNILMCLTGPKPKNSALCRPKDLTTFKLDLVTLFSINMLIMLKNAEVKKRSNFCAGEKESKLHISLCYNNPYSLLTKFYFDKLNEINLFSDKFNLKYHFLF